MKKPLLFISLALVLAAVAGAFAFISLRASGPETDISTATVDTPSMNGADHGAPESVVVTGKSLGADVSISDDLGVTGDAAPSKASKPQDSGSDLYDMANGEMCPYAKGDEL